MGDFVWPKRDLSKGAWFGSEELKAWVLAKMVKHRADDEIIRGHYQLNWPSAALGFKGCLVGCTLPRRFEGGPPFFQQYYILPGVEIPVPAVDTSFHGDLEGLYGIPHSVASLLDHTFEEQIFEEAADFAVASIEAIPAGMVYDPVVLVQPEDWLPSDTDEVLEFLRTGVLP